MSFRNQMRGHGSRAGVLAAALFIVGIGASWLAAQAGEGLAFGGGGDSVGTLPLMSPPPPTGPGGSGDYGDNIALYGPSAPAFALEGKLDVLLACITDAFPTGADGAYAIFTLSNDRARIEFYGHSTVILDRALFNTVKARGEVVVGSTFMGGVAQLSVAKQLRATQPLRLGVTDLKLRALDSSGVLNQEFLWHGISRDHQHRVIEVSAVGNSLRIEQRD